MSRVAWYLPVGRTACEVEIVSWIVRFERVDVLNAQVGGRLSLRQLRVVDERRCRV